MCTKLPRLLNFYSGVTAVYFTDSHVVAFVPSGTSQLRQNIPAHAHMIILSLAPPEHTTPTPPVRQVLNQPRLWNAALGSEAGKWRQPSRRHLAGTYEDNP